MASSRKAAPDLAGAVAASLDACLTPDCRLTLGYSGGLDSSVLLHILAGLRPRLGYSLSAVHVHHGLSPGADAWAEHCRRVCAELDVPLEVARVAVAPGGQGLEAAARQARYQVFSRLDVDWVVLAQHQDDQAETVLLQLLRGADLKGLAAMPARRALPVGRARLLRPLLPYSRADLAAYAARVGLSWVEDESNADTGLTRNLLRHEVMPLLERCRPGSAATLARAAGQFAEQARLLDELAVLDGGAALGGVSLELSRLAVLPPARARNLLRHFIQRAGGAVRRDALQEGLRQLLEAREDARVRVDFGAVALGRFQGRVWLIPQVGQAPREPVAWSGAAVVDLGGAGALEFRRVLGQGLRLSGGPVAIRLRQGGERMQLAPGRPARTLKNLLRETGVPPWLRQALPLVYVGGRLAWAAGIGMAVAEVAGPDEPGWLIEWRMPG